MALRNMCRRYATLKAQGITDNQLAIQIAGTDTQIRTAPRTAEILVGAIFHYFRRGVDSVAVGEALDITPVMARKVIYQLEQVAADLGFGRTMPKPPKTNTATPSKMARLRERGWSYACTAKKFGLYSHHLVVERLKKAGLWKPGLGAATNWSHRGRVDVERRVR